MPRIRRDSTLGRFVLSALLVVLAVLAVFAPFRGTATAQAQAQGAACQELIVNGGFEQGHTGWATYSSKNYDPISNWYPYSGRYGAWLVSVNDEEGWVSQTVTLPAARTLQLSYLWSLYTEENPGGAFDLMKVQLLRVDGALVATLAAYNNDSADIWVWNPVTIDLSAYAGQTLQLRFWGKNDANEPSSFFVDDVSIEACDGGGTPTPTSTPTVTLTPSPTLSITPGPSPTPTATPRARLYLPLVVR